MTSRVVIHLDLCRSKNAEPKKLLASIFCRPFRRVNHTSTFTELYITGHQKTLLKSVPKMMVPTTGLYCWLGLSICTDVEKRYLQNVIINRPQFCCKDWSVVVAIGRRTHKFQYWRHPFEDISLNSNVTGSRSPVRHRPVGRHLVTLVLTDGLSCFQTQFRCKKSTTMSHTVRATFWGSMGVTHLHLHVSWSNLPPGNPGRNSA